MIRETVGAVEDVKGVVTTGVRAVRTRLELLALEVMEEKAWTVRSILVTLAAFNLVTIGLLLAIVALALFAAEENRPAILAICAGVFLAAGAGAAAWVAMRSKERHPLFDETIAVLKGDEQGLRELMRGTGD